MIEGVEVILRHVRLRRASKSMEAAGPSDLHTPIFQFLDHLHKDGGGRREIDRRDLVR